MTKYLKSLIIVLSTIIGLFVIQCTVNLIPQSAIVDNIIQSLDDVEESGIELNRVRVIPGYYVATDDRPGDFAWLQIVYNVDSEHPVKSTLEMRRYTKYERFHEELRQQIEEGVEPNDSYSRYWHGMTIVLRLLLTILSLKEIKILLTAVVVLLWAICLFRCKGFRIPLIIGFILGGGLFCTLSVEYIPVFIIAPISMALVSKVKEENVDKVFLFTGLFTAYFDFLTAETLTLTLPLIYLAFHGKDIKKPIISWGLSYSITMGIRIVISLFIGDYAFGEILGDKFQIEKTPTTHYDGKSGLFKCIRDLVPVNSIQSMKLITVIMVVLIVIICLTILYWDKSSDIHKVTKYVVIGLIPIIRLILLDGHAYAHSEFACRALISAIIVLLLILRESAWKYLLRKRGLLKHE